MGFGSKLKSIRKINNLNQNEMANILFTTQGNYSQYENDIRTPTLDILKIIVEKFNVDANWLLSNNDAQIVNFNDSSTCNIASLKTENFLNSSEQFTLLEKKLDIIISRLENT